MEPFENSSLYAACIQMAMRTSVSPSFLCFMALKKCATVKLLLFYPTFLSLNTGSPLSLPTDISVIPSTVIRLAKKSALRLTVFVPSDNRKFRRIFLLFSNLANPIYISCQTHHVGAVKRRTRFSS